MTDIDGVAQPADGESRRWSEPVRIGEILAALRSTIEMRVGKAVSKDCTQAIVCGRLRKAG